MVKSPSTAAVDAVLSAAVAPGLKERGFRRSGRHWWSATDEAVRVVTGLAHRLNTARSTMFTLELGFAYPSLGEPAPERWQVAYCRHRHRIGDVSGDGRDLWWEVDATDPADVARVTADVARVWEQDGLPFLDACLDPRVLVERFDGTPKLLLEHGELGLRLGMRGPAERAVSAYLAFLLGHDPGAPTQWNPHPLARLIGPYSVAMGLLTGLGSPLPEEHRDRVAAAFADARAGAADGTFRLSPALDPVLVRALAEQVGADPAVVVPPTM